MLHKIVQKSIIESINHPGMTPVVLRDLSDALGIIIENKLEGAVIVLTDNKSADKLDAEILSNPNRRSWVYDRNDNLKLWVSTEKRHGGSGSNFMRGINGKNTMLMRVSTLKKSYNN